MAEVETEFGDLPSVTCQVGEVNQVFLNLLVNAAHAIADKEGESGARGRIWVRTSAEDGWVTIAVGDTGCGFRTRFARRSTILSSRRRKWGAALARGWRWRMR